MEKVPFNRMEQAYYNRDGHGFEIKQARRNMQERIIQILCDEFGFTINDARRLRAKIKDIERG